MQGWIRHQCVEEKEGIDVGVAEGGPSGSDEEKVVWEELRPVEL